MRKYTLRITQTALVSAVALVLSAVEMALPDLPIVIPGMKLGLSNIVNMFCLVALDLPTALFVCVIKALFALLTRGVTAFFMSLVGGLVSTILMYVLISIRKPKFGYIGIGICGAFFHNFGQIIVAFLMTDVTVFAYLPVLSSISLVTGSITGLVLSLLLPPLVKTKLFCVDNK